MRYNWRTELGIVLIFLTMLFALVCNGCSSALDRENRWELTAHQMFVKNMQLIMAMDSLETELEKCKQVKELRTLK